MRLLPRCLLPLSFLPIFVGSITWQLYLFQLDNQLDNLRVIQLHQTWWWFSSLQLLCSFDILWNYWLQFYLFIIQNKLWRRFLIMFSLWNNEFPYSFHQSSMSFWSICFYLCHWWIIDSLFSQTFVLNSCIYWILNRVLFLLNIFWISVFKWLSVFRALLFIIDILFTS